MMKIFRKLRHRWKVKNECTRARYRFVQLHYDKVLARAGERIGITRFLRFVNQSYTKKTTLLFGSK